MEENKLRFGADSMRYTVSLLILSALAILYPLLERYAPTFAFGLIIMLGIPSGFLFIWYLGTHLGQVL